MVKSEVKKRSTRTASETMLSKRRVRQAARRQARAQARKEALKRSPLPGSFGLTLQAFNTISRFWKPLGGIILIYLILSIVLAGGLSNFSATIDDIRHSTAADFGGPLAKAFDGFYGLISSVGAGSAAASMIQTALIVLESLVIIWALRQLLAGKAIAVKQAYYQSMTPLIPFILIIGLIIIQLLPITLGSAVLLLISSSLVAASGLISFLLTLIFAALVVWSVYMITSSLFALYIVTLPGMHPRQALRSAKNLVHFRRLLIMRRLLFLPLFILLIMGIIVIPLILLIPILVLPVFYLLTLTAFLFAHTYLYSLYRGLL